MRADLDQVEELAALVLNRIGADLLEIGLKPPVDGKIVRGNLDHRLLPRMEEGHVRGTNPGLDQQSIVKRHNFHDCFAGFDDAAHRVDVNLLDGTPDGGFQFRPRHPVAAGGKGFLQRIEFRAALADFGVDFRFHFRLAQRQTLLRLFGGGLRLGDGRRQRFDIALQRHDLLLKPQVVDAGINLALHQRRGDVPLFNGKRKAAFGLAFPAGQFFDFARALLILRLQQAHFGVLLLFAGMEDGHLVSDGLRVRNRQFFREGGRFAFQLGVKADDRKLVLQDPVLGVAVLALGKFVVELRKRRALFNDFPFTDQDGPQDTAFKVLDDLRATK